MAGQRVTVVLDLLELKVVIDALDTDIEWIGKRRDRSPPKLRLQIDYMLERHKALRDRLNRKFAPAYARLLSTATGASR